MGLCRGGEFGIFLSPYKEAHREARNSSKSHDQGRGSEFGKIPCPSFLMGSRTWKNSTPEPPPRLWDSEKF